MRVCLFGTCMRLTMHQLPPQLFVDTHIASLLYADSVLSPDRLRSWMCNGWGPQCTSLCPGVNTAATGCEPLIPGPAAWVCCLAGCAGEGAKYVWVALVICNDVATAAAAAHSPTPHCAITIITGACCCKRLHCTHPHPPPQAVPADVVLLLLIMHCTFTIISQDLAPCGTSTGLLLQHMKRV